MYDPVFEAVDEEVIGQLGGDVLSDAEAEEHSVSGPVLFYMPHCDSSLYSDVLEKNWSIDAMANVAILGNSFSHMQVSVHTACAVTCLPQLLTFANVTGLS